MRPSGACLCPVQPRVAASVTDSFGGSVRSGFRHGQRRDIRGPLADRIRVDADEVWGRGGYAIIGYQGKTETHLGFDPIIVHDRPQRPLRWSIKIGAPTAARRSNWGDWHFGVALKHALERLGHEAVDSKEAWTDRHLGSTTSP